MAKTKNGMTQRMEANRIPHVNISPNAEAHDIKGSIHAMTANKIFKLQKLLPK